MNKISLIHGDVTFVDVNEIPKKAKKVKWEKGFVIEKGEGVHTHTLENECEVWKDDKYIYLKQLDKPVQVNHEEHGLQTIKTNTGIVRKEIERVFDYEEMEARRVMD
jgi:hypothetical protein